jgi:hypothetical protein
MSKVATEAVVRALVAFPGSEIVKEDKMANFKKARVASAISYGAGSHLEIRVDLPVDEFLDSYKLLHSIQESCEAIVKGFYPNLKIQHQSLTWDEEKNEKEKRDETRGQ